MFRWIVRLIGNIIYTSFGHQILDATPETVPYQEPVESLMTTEDYVAATMSAGGWRCSCGRANLPYVSTCACGMNKHGQCSSAVKQRLLKQKQHQEELQAEIQKYHLLYESRLISREEYETEMIRLSRFGIE